MGRSVVSSGLKDVALSSNLKSWEGGKRRTKALLPTDPERTPADSDKITGWSMKPAGVRSDILWKGL